MEKLFMSKEERFNKEKYVSVQEYTGQGYDLRNGSKTDKIADDHLDEIDEGVTKFFKEEYKTDVIVHNVVGAQGGASVFVESKGEPHFYTFAVVPIDKSTEEVKVDKVWSQEGQVENALFTGIYGMVYEEEFTKLNNKLAEVAGKYNLVGKRGEAVANVGAGGFSNTYFYMSMHDKSFYPLLDQYLKNPDTNIEKFREIFNEINVDPNNILITIHMFMAEKEVDPNEEAFNELVTAIEEMEGIPTGAYSIYLHDNRIGKGSATAGKDNTLERSNPNKIIKK
ncbi:DUF1672 family protein [Pontibacillus litoralis]|uniref:DUF1672 family protein n=1 Tax=Pontibacillus litoralis JSM 072002 TaxID=1385512 RepID=A0A0A5HTI5_9BACI|nr:DUF1672 family protein [Pontibacillus litoralis]KGX86932.1 hypothetical protein N784_02940 [Pontibacillus litoralis JSM 072002]